MNNLTYLLTGFVIGFVVAFVGGKILKFVIFLAVIAVLIFYAYLNMK